MDEVRLDKVLVDCMYEGGVCAMALVVPLGYLDDHIAMHLHTSGCSLICPVIADLVSLLHHSLAHVTVGRMPLNLRDLYGVSTFLLGIEEKCSQRSPSDCVLKLVFTLKS